MRLTTKTRTLLLGSAVVILSVAGAQSAELPTMKPVRHEKAKACNVGGMTGIVVPGSNTCLKVGGYISTEVGMQR